MMDTIRIGGEEREVILRYVQVQKFLRQYNLLRARELRKVSEFHNITKKELKKLGKEGMADLVSRDAQDQEDASIVIPNSFFCFVVWRCLVKRGLWPFRRPFRSMSHMIKEIRADEFAGIVTFVGDRVLQLEMYQGDRETPNRKGKRRPASTSG